MNHIDPRLQGKKKGKSDHRNLLMKSIREDRFFVASPASARFGYASFVPASP
jgi:hypothetical protein